MKPENSSNYQAVSNIKNFDTVTGDLNWSSINGETYTKWFFGDNLEDKREGTEWLFRDGRIYSMCFLKDGRLVSGGDGGIFINKIDPLRFSLNIFIKDPCVYSVCGLKNGNLASSSYLGFKVYEINGNYCKVIYQFPEQHGPITNVMEMEDGRLCITDKKIRIWSEEIIHQKDFFPFKAGKGHTGSIYSITEINKYIITIGSEKSLKIWTTNVYKYKLIKTIHVISCCNSSGVSKLNENAIIIGGPNKLVIFDVLTFQSRTHFNYTFKNVWSILVLKEDQLLLGNGIGEMLCYNLSSETIISIQKVHRTAITCIIKSKDDLIFSSSRDGTINTYECF